LAVGTTVAQVTNLLAQPADKDEEGLFWRYSVFYSKTEVYFNREGEVEKIVPVGIEMGP